MRDPTRIVTFDCRQIVRMAVIGEHDASEIFSGKNRRRVSIGLVGTLKLACEFGVSQTPSLKSRHCCDAKRFGNANGVGEKRPYGTVEQEAGDADSGQFVCDS
jgi:hypothetical protein